MILTYRRKMLIAVIGALFFYCIVPLFAEDPVKTLSVDDAVRLAAESNITVQRSKITLDQLKRIRDFSWNSASPSVSASAGWTRPNTKTTYEYSEYIQGTVSISLTPSLYSAIKTAQTNYENGELTYDQAVRTVELGVRKAFYGLLYEQENIALQKRNLDTAKQQYDQNTTRYKNGQISELDMLTSKVSYEKLTPTLDSAQMTFSNDLASFKQTLGIDQKENIMLTGSLADVSKLGDITLEKAEEEAPAVRTAEKNVELAKNTLLARRLSAYGPVISGSWTYGKSATDVSIKNNADPSTTGSLTLGVTLPLDGLMPWSSSGQAVSNASDSVKDAELQLDNAKTTVAVQTQSYLLQIAQARAQLASLQSTIDLAQKTYDMMLTAYNHGSKDLLSLQSASDSLMSAKVNLASEEYTLISAVLNLENTLGIPFGTLGK